MSTYPPGAPEPPGPRAQPCTHRADPSPRLLYAVRHGQSTVNAGLRPATAAEADDMVIELTELGARQASALGRWIAALPSGHLPDIVLCSPYRRTVATWQFAEAELRAAGVAVPCLQTEPHLHDRFRGTLSHIPAEEVRQRYPEQYAAEQADPLGYRPPGGESFRDVATRLTGVVDRIARDTRHRRVLIVAHDAVILLLRRLLENLDDTGTLAVAAGGLAGNASITAWTRERDDYRLLYYDRRDHLPHG
ncbi:histidine phosphatase family protein [Nocardia jinanensis]|uniref:Phosphoglycerate mutase n=1 Tax=Nocardia jinanensis TaxID=382504 RepID=A0A917RDP1_9NOCA|nr:histidine phosphatase family protein [Nocardia jinanensis]GGL02290.1 phosphoglycerate mutase [Nocardia jinanensis]